MDTLLLVLDLIGTFVFALSGATAGVKSRLDLFGVLGLSYAAGNAGGVTRDLLIGAVPPAAISDWRYLAVSLLAGIVTFWRPSIIDRLRSPALLFDAAGLGLFAVASTQKALAFGLATLTGFSQAATVDPGCYPRDLIERPDLPHCHLPARVGRPRCSGGGGQLSLPLRPAILPYLIGSVVKNAHRPNCVSYPHSGSPANRSVGKSTKLRTFAESCRRWG